MLYLLADILYLLAGMLYLCCYRKRECVGCVDSLRFGRLRSELKHAQAVTKPALTKPYEAELKHAGILVKHVQTLF